MFDFVFGKSKKSTKGGDSPTDSGSTNDGFYQPMMLTDELIKAGGATVAPYPIPSASGGMYPSLDPSQPPQPPVLPFSSLPNSAGASGSGISSPRRNASPVDNVPFAFQSQNKSLIPEEVGDEYKTALNKFNEITSFIQNMNYNFSLEKQTLASN